MKYILVFLVFASCYSTKNIVPINLNENNSKYEVTKIDSINSYFLIYLKRNDSLFKIVSKKEIVFNSEKIKLKFKYKFELVSIWNQPIIINGINVSLYNTPHVNCAGFDDTTSICLERSLGINDIFFAKNLKGLYFAK